VLTIGLKTIAVVKSIRRIKVVTRDDKISLIKPRILKAGDHNENLQVAFERTKRRHQNVEAKVELFSSD